ncbi:MAG: hypothetical protein LBQ64_01345 [Bacteroidales bacterium]|jgi:hypothetical protein|nr:hypothetical protein [Bacteroidales bacterium]
MSILKSCKSTHEVRAEANLFASAKQEGESPKGNPDSDKSGRRAVWIASSLTLIAMTAWVFASVWGAFQIVASVKNPAGMEFY